MVPDKKSKSIVCTINIGSGWFQVNMLKKEAGRKWNNDVEPQENSNVKVNH